MLRTQELLARIEARAMGLRAAGVARGDRVAIMSPNRADWIITNLAILLAGAVTVPIYATQAHDHVQHILTDSGAKLLVVDTLALRDALAASGVDLPRTVAFDAEGEAALAALDDTGRLAAAAEPRALTAIADAVEPDDLAVLIYTSGTTGAPKGVMLTHRNIVSNVVDPYPLLEGVVAPGDAVLSVLPYAHIYESTNVFGYFLHEGTIYVNRRIEALLEDLRDVRPVLMFGVPRIFERMLAGIRVRARTQGGVRARLIPWALDAGRDYMQLRETGRRPGLARAVRFIAARALVLRKIRGLLGLDRLALFGSGSAPLHADTAWTFLGFGVRIVEGYGLTECSPVVTAAHPDRAIVGTVGPPIPNVEVKLAADGELLVRGPNVMKGYYRDAESTAAAIVDGWFHTGDIAEIDANGYVRITDRKRELFKTSGGKFVAPSRVEAAILRSAFVNQVMVVGSGRAHPAALVSPNWPALRAELDLPEDIPAADLARRSEVCAFLEREVVRQTSDLGSFEQVRRVAVLPRDLSVEADELSPTQKIKRRVVEARYAELIDALFNRAA